MQKRYLHTMLFVVLGSSAGWLGCGGGGSGGDGGPSGPNAQTGSVQGTVRDTENAAVANAAVSLTASGRQTRNTTTSASGSYTFNNIETGTWTVSVLPPSGYSVGVGGLTVPVAVIANQTTTATTIVLAKQGTGTGAPLTATVRMYETNFSPQTTTIRVNGTVTWRNDDAVQHNVRAPGISSPDLNQSQTFQRQFTSTGTVQYSCGLHAGMTGTINVVAQ